MVQPATRAETVMDPTALSVADVYAEALLETLPDNARAQAVIEQLNELVELLGGIDGAAALLVSPLIRPAERAEFVERIFAGRVDRPVEAFLHVLAVRGRLGLLPLTVKRMRTLLHERQRRVEVVVTTAAELDRDQRDRVARMLAESLAARLAVRFDVDRRLIGGMEVRVGDRVYDSAVAARIRRLARQISGRIGPEGRETQGQGDEVQDR